MSTLDTPLVLHVGTYQPDTLAAIVPDAEHYGDSWEEWGEAPTAGEPFHVTVPGQSPEALLAVFTQMQTEHPGLLLPMAWQSQAGCYACITPITDHSEPVLEIMATQHQRWLHSMKVLGYNVWKRAVWLERLEPYEKPSTADRARTLGR